MRKKPLKEIAKELNISASAVSFVLHNKPGVGEENVGRITRALQENNYLVTESALPRRTICFLKFATHNMLVRENPGFVNSIIDAVQKGTNKNNCLLTIMNIDVSNSMSVFQTLEKDAPSGVVFLETEMESKHYSLMRYLSVPYVVVDAPMEYFNCSTVTMDNAGAIYRMMQHFVTNGHKDIGFLANACPGGNCRARREAFLATMHSWKLPVDEEKSIFPVMPTMKGAYENVKALLEAGTRFPSALVACNDSIALGAMKAFTEKEIKIPQDISIIGFDDILFSKIANPPLTTMNVSCTQIGRVAVRQLLEQIEDPKRPMMKTLIMPSLAIRNSVKGVAAKDEG